MVKKKKRRRRVGDVASSGFGVVLPAGFLDSTLSTPPLALPAPAERNGSGILVKLISRYDSRAGDPVSYRDRRSDSGFGVSGGGEKSAMARRDHVDLGSSFPKRIDSNGLTPFKKNFYVESRWRGWVILKMFGVFLFDSILNSYIVFEQLTRVCGFQERRISLKNLMMRF